LGFSVIRRIGGFIAAVAIVAGAIYLLIAAGSTASRRPAPVFFSSESPATEGLLNNGNTAVPVAIDENLLTDYNYKRLVGSRDLQGLTSFSGRVFFVTADTRVRITESGKSGKRVRVLSGPQKGRSGWVLSEWIR